ncbi:MULTISPECIES: Rossmann-like and DUF2520 domain-containing protein [Flammeovirga]|uniref:DUF2520 domain-containing protein n=1 Tax=Flammeovirga agarivorans TaxID=2726742 RepID=A0A7X8SP01_9BACT|nr:MULTISPECIES: Rossmann-like and DUF2520 domain-containing protein [Flammeovirga]NLR93731.1 DUF2520 domain-containing protein [Flammeovirga agarivorans]
MKRVTLIGAGKVASHLGLALEDQGIVIEEVYSRDLRNAKRLARQFYDARPTDQLNFSNSIAEVFLIAVTDNVIDEIARNIILPNRKAILAHTSGATPMEVLAEATPSIGVFYPLQTFSHDKTVDFKEVPICIDGTSEKTLDVLAEIAVKLTPKVYHLNSEERKKLHISAVFACNFTNHLLEMSSQLAEHAGMKLSDLKHLVDETIEKAFALPSPKDGQTGPAIRRDYKTIKRHQKELEKEFPEMLTTYNVLSDSIMEQEGRYKTAEQIREEIIEEHQRKNDDLDNEHFDDFDL